MIRTIGGLLLFADRSSFWSARGSQWRFSKGISWLGVDRLLALTRGRQYRIIPLARVSGTVEIGPLG
jgi:hypothetical protein